MSSLWTTSPRPRDVGSRDPTRSVCPAHSKSFARAPSWRLLEEGLVEERALVHFAFLLKHEEQVAHVDALDSRPMNHLQQNVVCIIILLRSVCLSVAVRSLQAAVHARSSREISQTVRIDCHSFHSRVRISARPSDSGQFIVDRQRPVEMAIT